MVIVKTPNLSANAAAVRSIAETARNISAYRQLGSRP